MAYRPSLRRSTEEQNVELNLTPIMNLMVVLIPLLLTSAQFIKIGIIELNLPPASGAAGVAGDRPAEEFRTLDLTVSITDQGFYITNSLSNKTPPTHQGPTIPLKANGDHDYDELSRLLHQLKSETSEAFRDSDAIVIQAERDVDYQTLVSTMDATRSIRIDGHSHKLFPQVSLSAGIF